MFKPLLRTLPTLSGNFTIGCKLNEIVKNSTDEYYTYVRMATIMPLQNNIYNTNYELNLLNGKYEYDVSKYYYLYSNIFYKENFSFNKSNYIQLDLNNQQNSYNDSRNKDYEFGCKRIKYSQTNFQFCFYAPFYLDDINDLPEYFCIHIRLNDHLEKKIKVYLNYNDKKNYLLGYFKKYFKNVDDRVIFCQPDSLQATYFGIDIKQGGLVKYKDNEIGALYVNQTTINNFDYTICQGFERNNMIMSQIMPLSFMFNLNDIFSDYEKEFFSGVKIGITGYYYDKNDIKHDFYDFDIDYANAYFKYNKYNENTGKYEYDFGRINDEPINVMNVGYPALNEAKYISYAYTNKITPKYCKFKMMLSSDEDPYITNLNFGYSYLQMPNQKYGYFPTMFKGIFPQAYLNNKDLMLPIGHSKEKYYKTSRYFANTVFTDTTNIDKYIKLMSNYSSSWYDNIIEFSYDIFDKQSLWSDVKYSYAYHKGILYNFNELKDYSIDKFGLFMNLQMNIVDEKKVNNEICRAKYVLSNSEKSDFIITNFNNSFNMQIYDNETKLSYFNKIYDLSYSPNKKSYVLLNKVMKHDERGKYIKETNYISENSFYKYKDVIKILQSYIEDEYLYEQLGQLKIKGYLLLDGSNNINFFENYYDAYGEPYMQFMLTNELFNTSKVSNRFNWLYDSLYYTDTRSTDKHRLSSSYDKIDYNEDIFGKIAVFLEEEFIHINDIYNVLNGLCKEYNDQKYLNAILYVNNLDTYTYERYNEDNGITIKDYFVKVKQKSTEVYVDTYNLNNLISEYNKQLSVSSSKRISKISPANKTQDMFVKFINKDHIIEYYQKLNNDEENKSTIGIKSLLDIIYVKQRYWVIDSNCITIKDAYCTLNQFIKTYPLRYNKKCNATAEEILIIENLLKESNGQYDLTSETDISKLKSILERYGLNPEIYEEYDLNKNNIIDVDDLSYGEMYTEEYEDLRKYAATYKKIYEEYSNTQLLKWICDNLTNTRETDNKFLFNMFGNNISIDLCFKKKLVLLNDDLTNLIKNELSEYSNFLYLYVKDDCKKENYDIWPILTYNESMALNAKNIDEYLIPLFTNPYLNELDINNEISMIMNNKIKNNKYIYNSGEYFKEIDIIETVHSVSVLNELNELSKYNGWIDYALDNIEDTELKYKFSKNDIDIENENEVSEYMKYRLEYLYECETDIFYDYVKSKNITLYSIYDILNIKYDKLNEMFDDIIYDENYNIYICKRNGLTYAFYYLSLDIDNTNNSFNILNDYNLNICIESINGKKINEENLSYFNKMFYILQPFLKSNIFNDFSKDVNTIIYPYEAEILIKYIQSKANNDIANKYWMLKDNDSDILYDKIIKISNVKKIKLLRYFNYISPYMKRTNVIKDAWKLKLMKENNFINVVKPNILYKEDINIYKYDKLNVYSGIYDSIENKFSDKEIIDQYEYKHFNDNILFNLPENIEFNDDKLYSEEYVKNLNEDSNMLDNKLYILLKYFKQKGYDYTDIILFLYNKYESNIYIEKIMNNHDKSNYKYKISYKFKLI